MRLFDFANVLLAVSLSVSALWRINLRLKLAFCPNSCSCLLWCDANKTKFGCYRKQTYVGNQRLAVVKRLLNENSLNEKQSKWITFRQILDC